MNKLLFLILFSTLLLPTYLAANVQVIKKENSYSNTTLLVIAGIHGNEPGSYFAASILATNYTIKSKNLWIIPNLNKTSITANKRGINGDMNRKFSTIKKNDKDKKIIEDVKKLILSKNISLVLNLHDGHGFYRKKFNGNIFNPNAWGQTCVIDQCKLQEEQAFGNLNEIALKVKKNINTKLLQKHHAFDVRNTQTKFEDEEMQLSLTYFAVTHSKPAFAIESSKNLSTLSQKVYYQLLAIEEFMKIMKISFKRDFELTENNLSKIIKNYGNIRINNKIFINLDNIKKSLSYIPIKWKSNIIKLSHPLGAIKIVNKNYVVYIGNKKVTTLKPQYFDMALDCPKVFEVEIDGQKKSLKETTDIFVKDDFKIMSKDNVRVNIIGFTKKGISNESGMKVHKNSLNKKFSIDKDNKTYRIEFYKNDKFCSTSIVHFK